MRYLNGKILGSAGPLPPNEWPLRGSKKGICHFPFCREWKLANGKFRGHIQKFASKMLCRSDLPKRLFAGHDLDRFPACSHGTWLDFRDLQDPLPGLEEDEQLGLLREKGFEHENACLDDLDRGFRVAEIPENGSFRSAWGPRLRP